MGDADPARAIEVYYDGSCALCRRSRRWLERHAPPGRFEFVDSSTLPEGAACPVSRENLDSAVWVRLPGERSAGGFEAVAAALSAVPHWRVAAAAARLGPIRAAGSAFYRVVAKHRRRTQPVHGRATRRPER
ncbi:MAG TPA: DUF393 domain-containing protein [Thermoanaerobaculaceae bacterium]|nr:DUF393 domain-containing protein [Thermoanaerobaculaceae bacterium]